MWNVTFGPYENVTDTVITSQSEKVSTEKRELPRFTTSSGATD